MARLHLASTAFAWPETERECQIDSALLIISTAYYGSKQWLQCFFSKHMRTLLEWYKSGNIVIKE